MLPIFAVFYYSFKDQSVLFCKLHTAHHCAILRNTILKAKSYKIVLLKTNTVHLQIPNLRSPSVQHVFQENAKFLYATHGIDQQIYNTRAIL